MAGSNLVYNGSDYYLCVFILGTGISKTPCPGGCYVERKFKSHGHACIYLYCRMYGHDSNYGIRAESMGSINSVKKRCSSYDDSCIDYWYNGSRTIFWWRV